MNGVAPAYNLFQLKTLGILKGIKTAPTPTKGGIPLDLIYRSVKYSATSRHLLIFTFEYSLSCRFPSKFISTERGSSPRLTFQKTSSSLFRLCCCKCHYWLVLTTFTKFRIASFCVLYAGRLNNGWLCFLGERLSTELCRETPSFDRDHSKLMFSREKQNRKTVAVRLIHAKPV